MTIFNLRVVMCKRYFMISDDEYSIYYQSSPSPYHHCYLPPYSAITHLYLSVIPEASRTRKNESKLQTHCLITKIDTSNYFFPSLTSFILSTCLNIPCAWDSKESAEESWSRSRVANLRASVSTCCRTDILSVGDTKSLYYL